MFEQEIEVKSELSMRNFLSTILFTYIAGINEIIIWVTAFHMTCVEERGRTLFPRKLMSGDAQEPHDRAKI